jgi:hypothetical protein
MPDGMAAAAVAVTVIVFRSDDGHGEQRDLPPCAFFSLANGQNDLGAKV